MENVISACRSCHTKLVFFDNIYMYDASSLNPITEEHKINPPSKKGEVRNRISQMLLDAIEHEEIDALIARSADFYGPSIRDVSMLTEMIMNPMFQGKKVRWLGGLNFKHSFTYTPDAGRATALLGNTPDAYGEVWHLPTAENPPTMQEWIDLIAQKLGKKTKPQVISRFMLKSLGLFIPIMKEISEMAYQYDRDYVFSSRKFEERFKLPPTPYREGVDQIVRKDYA